MSQFSGQKVKERREFFGWTRQMMSLKWYARFGESVTVQTICNWEQGRQPHAENLMLLARLLAVAPAYFYQDHD